MKGCERLPPLKCGSYVSWLSDRGLWMDLRPFTFARMLAGSCGSDVSSTEADRGKGKFGWRTVGISSMGLMEL